MFGQGWGCASDLCSKSEDSVILFQLDSIISLQVFIFFPKNAAESMPRVISSLCHLGVLLTNGASRKFLIFGCHTKTNTRVWESPNACRDETRQ